VWRRTAVTGRLKAVLAGTCRHKSGGVVGAVVVMVMRMVDGKRGTAAAVVEQRVHALLTQPIVGGGRGVAHRVLVDGALHAVGGNRGGGPLQVPIVGAERGGPGVGTAVAAVPARGLLLLRRPGWRGKESITSVPFQRGLKGRRSSKSL
jgi:hypothetical protein